MVVWIELGRRVGVPTPIPFVMLYGAVVLTAASGGLRPGLVAGGIAGAFVAYSTQVGFGPATLAGGPVNVILGAAVFGLSGALVGFQADRRGRDLTSLGRAAAISLSDALAEGYVVANADGVMLEANDEYVRVVGGSREELIGKHLPTGRRGVRYLNPDGSPARLRDLPLPRAVATGVAQRDQLVGIERSDGSQVWVRMSCSPAMSNGREQLFVTTVTDVTARVLEERRAAEDHATLATILANAPNAIMLFEQDGTILRAAAATTRIFGWRPEELAGEHVSTLVPQPAGPEAPLMDSDSEVGEAWAPLGIANGETREVLAVRQSGETFPAVVRVARVDGATEDTPRFVTVFQDVSRRKELEAQLLQAQRLESVGQLAAGIAHEINTPTQFVGDNTRFLQDAFRELQPLRESHALLLAAADSGSVTDELVARAHEVVEQADVDYLFAEIPSAIEQTLEGVERVATIVRAMKDFSHPGSVTKELTDLNRALESTTTVARNEWKYAADLRFDLAKDLPQVPCMVGELNQAFLNIIVNAAHAIEDATGGVHKGVITVSTAVMDDQVEIRIGDTGGGIPEEVRDRVFDPFFTTKAVGKGTGQGLAIARSVVVDKHGGALSVESNAGEGTTFVIRLPLSEDAQGADAA